MEKSSFLKKYMTTAMLFIVVALAVVALLITPKYAQQAIDPVFPIVKFQGEYRIGEEKWMPVTENIHISSMQGPVTLKGNFIMRDPETNELLGNAEPETMIAVYLNHLNLNIFIDNQIVYQSDAENPIFGAVTCGQIWEVFTVMQEEPIEIVLTNSHKYGNENAIDDFLDSFSIYSGGIFERQRVEEGEWQRVFGIAILLSAMAMLGVALFASKIHINNSSEMAVIGAIILFAGIYYIFSSENICLWNNNYKFNTSILCICEEFYLLFITILFIKILPPKTYKAGKLLIGISLCSMIGLFITNILDIFLIYDTWFIWGLVEFFVCFGLLVCLFLEQEDISKENILIYRVNIFLMLSYMVDFVAICFGWWENTNLSMLFFCVIFIGAVILMLKVVPQNLEKVAKAKELETEQKLLQAKLHESRISVMISQIQPHFIYNSLAVIQELCYSEPEKAEKAIGTLADFLKGNMAISLSDKLVCFQDELKHTKKYLEIEHLRFEEQLSVVYDIQADGFSIPALTLQPIVENAIRHGVRQKEEGGTVTISSRESEKYFEILVEDDGPGFNHHPENNKEGLHIGINNVKERLEHMCNGTLEIISEEGKGTCIRIRIEKEFTGC